MADPFSIIAGSAGLIDVCIRLGGFLKQAKDGFQKVDEELDQLSQDISAVRSVSNLIRCNFETELVGTRDANDQQVVEDHWRTTHAILEGCQANMERIASLITDVLGKENHKHAKFSNLRKFLKQQSKECEFAELKQRLRSYLDALQMSLAAVTL